MSPEVLQNNVRALTELPMKSYGGSVGNGENQGDGLGVPLLRESSG